MCPALSFCLMLYAQNVLSMLISFVIYTFKCNTEDATEDNRPVISANHHHQHLRASQPNSTRPLKNADKSIY